MRKIFSLIILIFFFKNILLEAAPNSRPLEDKRTSSNIEFNSVPFGSTEEDTFNKLANKFHLVRNPRPNAPEFEFVGEGELSVIKGCGFISIYDYPLGNAKLDVTTLDFGNIDKLYRYSFRSLPRPANNLSYVLNIDAKFFSDIFEIRFGKPSLSFSPSIIDIEEDTYAYFRKWNLRGYTIFVGLSTSEFQYYSIAIVENQKFKSEEHVFLENKNKNGVKDAVGSF